MKKTTISYLYLLLTIGLVTASSPLLAQGKRPTIYAVNYPLYYFAERIAGNKADIIFPVPDDVDPAYWMPDTTSLIQYQKADLILANGAHYSRWLDLVSMPENRVINTSKHIEDRYIHMEEETTHSHGLEGKHSHENIAFTTWLDLDIAKEQARSIFIAVARLLPKDKSEFEKNLNDLLDDLHQLDRELQSIAKIIGNKKLLASHPVYQYFSRRYQLNVSNFHWEPDIAPPAEEWQRLEMIREKQAAKWMLWESTPRSDTVSKLRNYGIEPIVFRTIANRPENGNFISVMTENIAAMNLIIDSN